jgi:DNA-binding CsgD family transcriptional regulator
MGGEQRVSWRRINDFIATAGSARNFDEFSDRVIDSIGDLIPFDLNHVFVNREKNNLIESYKAPADIDKWIRLLNDQYSSMFPVPDCAGICSYFDVRDTPLYAEFLRPQGIHSSICIFRHRHLNSSTLMMVNRASKRQQFREHDQAVCRIIQPHLSNLCGLYTMLENREEQPDAFDIRSEFGMLTHTEAEIVAMLCRRYSTGMIETRLLIRRATVYKHIENIFNKLRVCSRQELVKKVLHGFGNDN